MIVRYFKEVTLLNICKITFKVQVPRYPFSIDTPHDISMQSGHITILSRGEISVDLWPFQ